MAGALQAPAHQKPLLLSILVAAVARPTPASFNMLPLGFQAGHSFGLGWGSSAQPTLTGFCFEVLRWGLHSQEHTLR